MAMIASLVPVVVTWHSISTHGISREVTAQDRAVHSLPPSVETMLGSAPTIRRQDTHSLEAQLAANIKGVSKLSFSFQAVSCSF